MKPSISHNNNKEKTQSISVIDTETLTIKTVDIKTLEEETFITDKMKTDPIHTDADAVEADALLALVTEADQALAVEEHLIEPLLIDVDHTADTQKIESQTTGTSTETATETTEKQTIETEETVMTKSLVTESLATESLENDRSTDDSKPNTTDTIIILDEKKKTSLDQPTFIELDQPAPIHLDAIIDEHCVFLQEQLDKKPVLAFDNKALEQTFLDRISQSYQRNRQTFLIVAIGLAMLHGLISFGLLSSVSALTTGFLLKTELPFWLVFFTGGWLILQTRYVLPAQITVERISGVWLALLIVLHFRFTITAPLGSFYTAELGLLLTLALISLRLRSVVYAIAVVSASLICLLLIPKGDFFQQQLALYSQCAMVLVSILFSIYHEYYIRQQFVFEKIQQQLQQKTDFLYQSLSKLQRIDAVTQLYTHLEFKPRFEMHRKMAYRLEQRLSVILLDIDYLSEFRTMFGEATTNLMLSAIADALQVKIQAYDHLHGKPTIYAQRKRMLLTARIYDSTFAIVVPLASQREVVNLAQELMSAVDSVVVEMPVETRVATPVRHQLTASVGIADTADNGIGHNSLMSRAQNTLEEARKNGRHRICLNTEISGIVSH